MLFPSSILVAAAAATAAAAPAAQGVPEGFVATKGTKFSLDGEDFPFAGSNAYYFPFDNVRPCILPMLLCLSDK